MSELLKNTYTLAAGIIMVCTIGSMGGVSLYIINQGFADQEKLMQRVSALEISDARREESARNHEKIHDKLEDSINRIHARSTELYLDE